VKKHPEKSINVLKQFLVLASAILTLSTAAQVKAAMPEFGGSLRVRYENKQNFKFNEPGKVKDDDYLLTQLRLNIKWKLTDGLVFFLEGQDARAGGESGFSDRSTPNIFSDAFDLHQGYFDLSSTGGRYPYRIRIGRQKFNLGVLRLIASLEWVNTARVWDGIRMTIGKIDERRLDLFASRLVAVDPTHPNDWAKTGSRLFNSDFHGVYYTGRQIETYWLLRHESIKNDAVQTVGSRFTKKNGPLALDAEVAYQFGKFGGLDHRAYMGHFCGFYLIVPDRKTKLGLAYNIGSGDSNANDGTHETFDNQYPLNHAYYGYMDFFSLQNVHNAEATFQTNLLKKIPLRIAYQGFWLLEEDSDAWYNASGKAERPAAGKDVDPYVGSEIDITIKLPNKIAPLEIGYSHFFYGAYINDTRTPSTNPEDADFFYVMAKRKF